MYKIGLWVYKMPLHPSSRRTKLPPPASKRYSRQQFLYNRQKNAIIVRPQALTLQCKQTHNKHKKNNEKSTTIFTRNTAPGIHYILGNAFNKQTRHKINHRTMSDD